jgi:catechol 2,3-dioxygenase-like lactoylglutathione lyase family enzyme
MSYRVLAANRTSFTVSSLDRTIGFFRDCLGFQLLNRAPRDPDGVTIEFIEIPGAKQ